MARKKKSSGGGTPGAPLWMATYGDMVTLVLCFFVLLYAFSTLDIKKFNQLSVSLQTAFSIQPGGPAQTDVQGTNQGGITEAQPGNVERREESSQTEVSKQLLALVQEALKSEKLNDEIKYTQDERGVIISMSEQMLFEEGSAKLRPSAQRIIYKLTEALKRIPNMLEIEGHTDSNPLQNSIYRDNWGLSAARAASVVTHLNERDGVPANRLKAVGLGSSKPMSPNDTEEHMSHNRRVDMVILSRHSIN
ncbi:MAG: OmpA family protein [Synergistaceae bacterium]|jgi:chemotaxis protein MotB|nr:OmpA family protein [Synergistaceae bacterium]